MTLKDFANLSVVLTGYPLSTILPDFDTQHQAQELLDFLQAPGRVSPGTLQQLDAAWTAIENNSDTSVSQQVQDTLMGNPALARLVQNIIMMWYLGAWYDLAQPLNTKSFVSEVISGKAYKNGLAWGTMGAHPMGYSEENFGYWNTVPVLLQPQPSN
ncbi:hypothetical protein [Mucilaginibacter xinganensis]|uniref:Gluconate 2-dehydrogenase subunit 3 n=1 Tax=Mucilaginibacter xinganensis TaxID=1234841 RepID=A0A223NXG0_9SPHI|nr:hypothetical protein [Mucilaginibacter xinganensis]ASU34569.1 hypothetical protein MuYL_2682 [Mucilaginibacter xinganensis]